MIDQREFDVVGSPGPGAAQMVHGLYPLSLAQNGSEVFRFTWVNGTARLPYPQLGAREDLPLVLDQRGFEFPAIFSITVAETPVRTRIGTCELETWGIRTEVQLKDEIGWETFTHWYPELGTGVVVSTALNGALSETEDYVGIEW
ncbi:MAG: hypothetical protein MK180_10605 [Rhodobacteraceae bacterium]|nr:hypothetical protein [Paracoccaceae bacterium]